MTISLSPACLSASSHASFGVCMLVLMMGGSSTSAQEIAYVGQTPPGIVPEVFAPGVVSTPSEYEYGSVFTADGLELYYGVNVGNRAEIRTMRWMNGRWSSPQVVVSDTRFTFGDPFLSPDEQRLYFISNRPLSSQESTQKDYDIWYVQRTNDGWSEPINVGPINSSADEYYISFSADGRIYFASNRNAGQRERNFDIYVANVSSGRFHAPTALRGEINTGYYEADAFVSPDESYMIYASSRPDGLGQGDLYISFRGPDGTWSEGKNLGPRINSNGHELCPFVTADNRFFFFTSNEDIYWVDASVLTEFR